MSVLSYSELQRRLRQTGGRGRKLRGLAQILAPYRWRVLAMFASLVLATAAALAPAPLAKVAIDQGIRHHDVGSLDVVVGARVSKSANAAPRWLRIPMIPGSR